MPEKYTAADLNELAAYLRRRSKEICKDNGCTEDEHNCESYAYLNVKFEGKDLTYVDMVDICLPDYLQSNVNCALCLPFEGKGEELLDLIESEAEWTEEDQDRELLKDTDDEDLPLIAGQIKTSEGEQELKRRIDGFNQ